MFLIRSANIHDLNDLYELSKLENFLNLPNDKEKLTKNIQKSISSFNSKNFSPENVYLFVLEDLELNKIIGTSVIHAQHGTPESPHFALKVGKEHKKSFSVDKAFTHTTLKLDIDSNGPTEIGGLVLAPEYRGTGKKLGKQIAFSRFLFMAFHKNFFRENVHAELLPPFNEDGSAPLWKALGEKFFHMDYQKADLLSRKNKEFILSLFPSENIYASLLEMEAQKAIGAVSKNTIPLKKMLEKIGFNYISEIDPFDGGPHYRCSLDQILPIKKRFEGNFEYSDSEDFQNFLIRSNNSDDFSCFRAEGFLNKKHLILKKSKLTEQYLDSNKEIQAIPF